MEFAILRAIFIINAFLQLVGAQHNDMGGMGSASSSSKPGKCPPYMYEPAECPDDIENFCTQGDDSTCAEELKCCYTGCEYDCLVPDDPSLQPPQKGDKGTGGPKGQEGIASGVASSRSSRTNFIYQLSVEVSPVTMPAKEQSNYFSWLRQRKVVSILKIKLQWMKEKGICPPSNDDVECPDEIENYCTVGDDSTCADDLKCCYTGCEYDCMVPDPAQAPPAREGDKGTGGPKGQEGITGGVASSRSKPGICPPYEDAECPDDIENFCTRGDDNTCAVDLKCCYTGCEYDCIVPDPAQAPPAREGSAGNEGEKAENGLVGPPGPPGPPGSTSAAPTGGPGSK